MSGIAKIKLTLAPLLAFFVPGSGHMMLGRPAPGLLLLLGALTDIAAIIRFGDQSGGTFVLIIVLLGLALPVFWFYSVFGTLQLASKLRREAESADGEQARTGTGTGGAAIAQGIAAIVLGCVLWVLVQTSMDFSAVIAAAGTYAPGSLLLLLALVWSLRSVRRSKPFRMGRFTSATALFAVGGLLLWDQIAGRNDIAWVGQWWPAGFVLLDIEIVIASLAVRASGKRVSFDLGGVFLASLFALTAFAVTQYASMPFRWLDEFKVNLTGTSGFSEEKGFRFEKESLHWPLTADTDAIAIENTNGDVMVKKGAVSDIVVETVMWVDTDNKAEAEDAAANSAIEVHGDEKIVIKSQGHAYGTNGERLPRMNMVITIPEGSAFGQRPVSKHDESPDRNGAPTQDGTPTQNETSTQNVAPSQDMASVQNQKLPDGGDASGDASPDNSQDISADGSEVGASAADNAVTNDPASSETSQDEGTYSSEQETSHTKLEIGTINGSVEAADLVLGDGLTIKVTTGEIKLSHIVGPVYAITKNGGVQVAEMEGDVTLDTSNGDIKASNVKGIFDASASIGNIALEHVGSDVDADTKNGQIVINEAQGAVRADSLNGDIDISSGTVSGDWDINSSIGEIHVAVPEVGDYSVNGSVTFGDIASDLPLTINKKTIRGSVGAGTYRINIDANSSIAVNHYKP